jgi:hypothetical protein
MVEMVQMAEPYRNPETGVYYLRRQIPKALRIEFGGRSLWKRSLETKDAQEARRLFIAANADLEARFSRARTEIAERAERDRLSPAAAAQMVDRAMRVGRGRFPMLSCMHWAEEYARERIGGHVEWFPNDAPEHLERLRDAAGLPGELWLQFTASQPQAEIIAGAWNAIELVRGHMKPRHDAYPDIARTPPNDAALATAITDRVRVELADLRQLLAAPFRKSTTRLRPDMRISELFTAWKGKREPNAKGANEAASTIDDFIAFAGDITVVTVTGDLIYDFRDAVASLPRTMPRADRRLPFPERLAKYHEHSGACVSPASVKKRVGYLQAMIGLAAKQRWIETNPATGIEIEGYSRSSSGRRPFRDEELAQLFRAPLFTKPEGWSFSRATVSDATLAWSLLLGLTNGARLEEIGQTELANIRVEGGVIYFDLGFDAAVKTESSRRAIPIHERVIDCGFERYVAALRAAGQMRLFPDLRPNKFDRLCHDASRLANRIIDREVTEDPALVFHSLRHTFKDLGRDANLQTYILEQIMGHAGVSEGDRYGFGARIKSLKRELDRIPFDMIDWDRIIRVFAGLDWAMVVKRTLASVT